MAFDIARIWHRPQPAAEPVADPFPSLAPRTTDGRLIYAIGDIHGRYDLLKELLARLLADSRNGREGPPPMLVFCGDYIDRGPQSAEVVEALVWLCAQSDFEVRTLKGNHEEALLDYLEEPLEGSAWVEFGGAETLESYGVAAPSPEAGGEDHVRARNALLQRMPAAHLRFFEGLELMVVVGDYAIVHAGVRPDAPLSDQHPRDLLWIRRAFLDAPGPFEKVIVHGHTWLDETPQVHAHRIGIDTGAHATGVLTAVRLEGSEVSFIQTGLGPARPEAPLTLDQPAAHG